MASAILSGCATERSGASARRPQLAASAFLMVLHTTRFVPLGSFAWGHGLDACDPERS